MQQPIFKRKKLAKEFLKTCQFPLTVAVAGMGYGKTMAARLYLEEENHRYVWLSIGHNEMSMDTLWDSLVMQLRRMEPAFSEKLGLSGFPMDAVQREKFISLIREYTHKKHTILVIDDYHFANATELDLLIERIVLAKIPGFHVLMLSRTLPQLNMEEMIMKEYCYYIKSQYFEMNQEEIEAYFSIFNLRLTTRESSLVFSLSEGWIAAIYLMVQHYLENRQIALGLNIFRLIETAVMPQYSEEEVDLLQIVSLFDTMSAEQASYIAESPGAGVMLRRISHGNTFVQYNEKDKLYRMHLLFSAYLQTRWEESVDRSELDKIYTRCGQWHLEQGNIVSGLKFLIKGRAYGVVLQEFGKPYINRVIDGNVDFMVKLFRNIPMSKLKKFPLAHLALIGFFITNVDPEEGLIMLQEAEREYVNAENITPEIKRQLRGEIQLLYAYTHFNDAGKMAVKIKEAKKLMPLGSRIANEDKIITFGCPHGLFMYHTRPGRLKETMNLVQQAFKGYTKLAHGCGKGFDELLLAEYWLDQDGLERALISGEKAFLKAKSTNQIDVMIAALLTILRGRLAQGDVQGALYRMKKAKNMMKEVHSPALQASYELCLGYIGCQMNQDDLVPDWIKERHLNESGILYEGLGFSHVVYGKWLLGQQSYVALEVACDEMMTAFRPYRNVHGYIHAHLLKAIARTHLYGNEAGKKSLEKSLALSKRDNLVIPLAEYGKELAVVLEGRHMNLLNQQKLEWEQALANRAWAYWKKTCLCEVITEVHETLTKRELEILQQICKGRTNGSIAEKLFLAEVTVRKHVTSIYRKLKVSGRAAAVRKAVEENIV